VVTLLIADRFLEVSDYWRSDDSLIATGANLFVSGRENGMRLRQQQPKICSSGRSALSDSPARLNCVGSTTIQELVRLCRPSTALHGGCRGGGRQQQTTLRSRPRIRFLGAACGRSIAAGVRQAKALAIGVREKAKRS
jgi:hypothetical protein